MIFPHSYAFLRIPSQVVYVLCWKDTYAEYSIQALVRRSLGGGRHDICAIRSRSQGDRNTIRSKWSEEGQSHHPSVPEGQTQGL